VYLKLRCYCRKFLGGEARRGDGDGDGGDGNGDGDGDGDVGGGEKWVGMFWVGMYVDCGRMDLILGVGRDERGG